MRHRIWKFILKKGSERDSSRGVALMFVLFLVISVSLIVLSGFYGESGYRKDVIKAERRMQAKMLAQSVADITNFVLRDYMNPASATGGGVLVAVGADRFPLGASGAEATVGEEIQGFGVAGSSGSQTAVYQDALNAAGPFTFSNHIKNEFLDLLWNDTTPPALGVANTTNIITDASVHENFSEWSGNFRITDANPPTINFTRMADVTGLVPVLGVDMSVTRHRYRLTVTVRHKDVGAGTSMAWDFYVFNPRAAPGDPKPGNWPDYIGLDSHGVHVVQAAYVPVSSL